jgi:tungstate transport system permease protein
MRDAVVHAFSLLLSGDAALWRIVWVSLKTSLLALLFAAPPAVLLGYWFAVHAFPGRRAAIWLLQALLAVPTVLVGLLLYMLLSRQGPLGGFETLFTQSAIVLGQMLIVLPLLAALTLAQVQGADPRLRETAITLGAAPVRVALTVLHEVRFGVVAALIAGFGRVIAEVGCALMVGGNILGQTRTMTTAIALETSRGEFAQGIALGAVLLLLALLLNAALLLVQGDAARRTA